MLQITNNKIQRGFSRSAKSYDLYSGLHREIADKLFTQVVKERLPSALLDVGCGTGYLTVRFKDRFPQSKIVGLDFSPEMLEVARPKHEGIEWVLADSNNLPFPDGCFDVVVSNLAYQWAGDLSRAFSEAGRVLAPDGVLACTLFGFHTCRELFQSLDEAKAKALQFARLPGQARVLEALAASGFKDPKVNGEQIKIAFEDMYGLIDWLRSIGANNLPASPEGGSRIEFLGPEAISRAASIYHKKFPYLQGVGATFEVIRVYVKR
jgi:malonyl-CoA O-methyltransferase